MTGRRQVWLVARRELHERSRSRAFRASLVVMVLAVVAMIVLPAVLTGSARSRDIGITGPAPSELARTIQTQADAVGTTAHIRRYDSLATGEQAVRDGEVDVLVVDGRQLEWPRRADEKLKAIVTGSIQLVAVRERAGAAGINPDELLALVAPVPVTNVELSKVAGRSAGDETATTIMIGLLLLTISVYGGLVLSGVVEEKASRVVEVLLARVPAQTLLAGKVLGIGLLGLAQVAVTAVAALIAIVTVGSFDVPAVRGGVLGWVVVWFVLGYALYATLYGALGSLASRPEDAQSTAGPAMMVMVVSYFAAFIMVARADSVAALAISYFPTTAPLAMPSRIAMGAAAWWEPIMAGAITIAAILGLVRIGGRLYATAILHGGPTLSLRDAWRATRDARIRAAHPAPTRGRPPRRQLLRAIGGRRTAMSSADQSGHPMAITMLTIIGVAIGVAVALFTSDVIIGVIAGAGFIALTVQLVKLWTGGSSRRSRPQ